MSQALDTILSTLTGLVRSSYTDIFFWLELKFRGLVMCLRSHSQLGRERAEVWNQMCSNMALATLLATLLLCSLPLTHSSVHRSCSRIVWPHLVTRALLWSLSSSHGDLLSVFPSGLSVAVPLNGMFFPESFLCLLLIVAEISARSNLLRELFLITILYHITLEKPSSKHLLSNINWLFCFLVC